MKLFTILFATILLAGCSKKDTPVIPPTYITGIVTNMIHEPSGLLSLQIKYTVSTVTPSLQLIRDADNVTMEHSTEVKEGAYTTYDRDNYSAGAKYHFLVNNSIIYQFTAQ